MGKSFINLGSLFAKQRNGKMAKRLQLFSKRTEIHSKRSSGNTENGVVKRKKSESPIRTTKEIKADYEKTSKTDNPQETIICGSVELTFELGTKVYKLQCGHCEEKFFLPFWETFTKHMEGHQRPLSLTEPASSVIVENHYGNYDYFVGATNNISDKENNSEGDGIEDMECEPKKKKAKKDPIKKTNGLISFERTEKKCIIGFLNLLELHPILWYQHQSSIDKKFEKTLAEVISKFNAEWPNNSINEQEMRQSISQIKNLYMKGTSADKSKYSDYFKLCKKIDSKGKKSMSVAAAETYSECQLCGEKDFADDLQFKIHSFWKHDIGQLPFQCKKCERGYETAGRLSSHEKQQHHEKEFFCQECSKDCKNRIELVKHVKAKHRKQKHVCETCGKFFNDGQALRKHKVYHEPPKMKCEICARRLYKKSDLTDHMKSHENSREYKCHYCPKTFNHQTGVTVHERNVHTSKMIEK